MGSKASAGELVLGLLAAAVAFGFAFRGRWPGFWARMAIATGSLGLFRLARQQPHISPPVLLDIAWGLLSAAMLYGIFQIGDRLIRRWMPRGEMEIRAIYRLREEAPPPVIAGLLAAVIAPAEELFWRGFVVDALAERYPPVWAAVLGATLYAGVHAVTANGILIGAAGMAGLFWSIQYLLQRRLAPVIISHIVWDLWIFLIAPTPSGQESSASSRH